MARRYRFDDIEVDLQDFRLLKAGKPIAIEPKALNLLIFLVENRGRLIGRRELIDAVWNSAFVTDHVLNRAIGQLRRQLEDDPKEPRYVETVPTLGYRFIAHVETETAEAKTAADKLTASNPIQGWPPADGTNPAPPTPLLLRLGRRKAIAAGIVLASIVSIVALWIVIRPHLPGVRSIQSLAVLPLENLSGDASSSISRME